MSLFFFWTQIRCRWARNFQGATGCSETFIEGRWGSCIRVKSSWKIGSRCHCVWIGSHGDILLLASSKIDWGNTVGQSVQKSHTICRQCDNSRIRISFNLSIVLDRFFFLDISDKPRGWRWYHSSNDWCFGRGFLWRYKNELVASSTSWSFCGIFKPCW